MKAAILLPQRRIAALQIRRTVKPQRRQMAVQRRIVRCLDFQEIPDAGQRVQFRPGARDFPGFPVFFIIKRRGVSEGEEDRPGAFRVGHFRLQFLPRFVGALRRRALKGYKPARPAVQHPQPQHFPPGAEGAPAVKAPVLLKDFPQLPAARALQPGNDFRPGGGLRVQRQLAFAFNPHFFLSRSPAYLQIFPDKRGIINPRACLARRAH